MGRIVYRPGETPVNKSELLNNTMLTFNLKSKRAFADFLEMNRRQIYFYFDTKRPMNMSEKYWMRITGKLLDEISAQSLEYESRIAELESQLGDKGEICGHCPIRRIGQ